MGIRVWPVIEGKDKHLYHAGFIEWKWLTERVSSGVLEAAARQLKLEPINKFESATRQDAIESMGIEEVEEYEENAELREDGRHYCEGLLLWNLERKWFAPQTGLATVRGLVVWMNEHPQTPNDLDLSDIGAFQTGAAEYDAEGFIYILRALETILTKAEAAGQRFYLACDA